MSQKRIMKLATRGKRFGAGMIDFIPITISMFYLISGLIVGIISYAETALNNFNNDSYYNSDPYIYHKGISGGGVLLFLIFIYLAFQLYFYTKSQSIGKAILGLRVVDANTGRPVGFAKMLLREIIVKKASGSIFYLGYIWILFDKYNRSWHDKILDTYVIDERPGKVQPGYFSYDGSMPSNNMNLSGGVQVNTRYGNSGLTDTAADTNSLNPREEIYRNLTRNSETSFSTQPFTQDSASDHDKTSSAPILSIDESELFGDKDEVDASEGNLRSENDFAFATAEDQPDTTVMSENLNADHLDFGEEKNQE